MNGARFVHDRLELHGWQVPAIWLPDPRVRAERKRARSVTPASTVRNSG
jgi:hypothetical protein